MTDSNNSLEIQNYFNVGLLLIPGTILLLFKYNILGFRNLMQYLNERFSTPEPKDYSRQFLIKELNRCYSNYEAIDSLLERYLDNYFSEKPTEFFKEITIILIDN